MKTFITSSLWRATTGQRFFTNRRFTKRGRPIRPVPSILKPLESPVVQSQIPEPQRQGFLHDTQPLLNQIHHPSELGANLDQQVRLSFEELRKPESIILANPLLVIGRQVELMNVFLGFEQQNKYTIRNAQGSQIAWILEEQKGLGGVILRQLLRTRRKFEAEITDMNGVVLLRVHRPITWFLNSTISISRPDGTEIGVVKSDWHLWRRRYDLFVHSEQFARIDGGFWAWDFVAADENQSTMSLITRKFIGFMKEIFTDMGQYVIHYDSICERNKTGGGLSLDERSVLLAAAISIDIDYFSRHSNSGASTGFFFWSSE